MLWWQLIDLKSIPVKSVTVHDIEATAFREGPYPEVWCLVAALLAFAALSTELLSSLGPDRLDYFLRVGLLRAISRQRPRLAASWPAKPPQ